MVMTEPPSWRRPGLLTRLTHKVRSGLWSEASQARPIECPGDSMHYLIGSMPTDDRARFEGHLRSCLKCQRETRSLEPVIETLAGTAKQISPPEHLGRAIIRQARISTAVMSGPHHGAPGGARPASPPVAWFSHRRVGAIVTAGSLTMCIASLGYSMLLHSQTAQNAIVASRLAETLSLVYHPGAVTRTLAGTDRAPRSTGRLAVLPESNRAVLVTYNLPSTGEGSCYQLWAALLDGAGRFSGGTFTVDHQGQGYLVIDLHGQSLNRVKLVQVTREPAQGSPGPTGPEVLTGNL